jgi:hypothetical protein
LHGKQSSGLSVLPPYLPRSAAGARRTAECMLTSKAMHRFFCYLGSGAVCTSASTASSTARLSFHPSTTISGESACLCCLCCAAGVLRKNVCCACLGVAAPAS